VFEKGIASVLMSCFSSSSSSLGALGKPSKQFIPSGNQPFLMSYLCYREDGSGQLAMSKSQDDDQEEWTVKPDHLSFTGQLEA
jgi:hypothetical protein